MLLRSAAIYIAVLEARLPRGGQGVVASPHEDRDITGVVRDYFGENAGRSCCRRRSSSHD